MSEIRQVRGLWYAQRASEAPFGKPRARGAKAQGLRYERTLAKMLPQATHGCWYEFQDRQGKGWCQPDLILDLGGALGILEVKYTWTPDAARQLDGLYKPVVALAERRQCFGLTVCKVLVPGVDGIVTASLGEALKLAAAGSDVVLHWLPGTPLGPLPTALAYGPLAVFAGS